jgi:hypothetical protein
MSCRLKASPTDVLGISEDAKHDDIRATYRRLSKVLHPDKGGSKVLFQLVAEAYEILTIPRSSRQHSSDNGRSRTVPKPPQRSQARPQPRHYTPRTNKASSYKPPSHPATRPAPHAGTRPGPEWQVPSQEACPVPKINHSWPGVRTSIIDPPSKGRKDSEVDVMTSPRSDGYLDRIDHTWPGIRMAHKL